MPPNYKYQFISLGRSKALEKAASLLHDLHRQVSKSGMLAPAVVEKLTIANLLVRQAAGNPIEFDDVDLLERTFGKGWDEERKD
jgi:hypothetical protein